MISNVCVCVFLQGFAGVCGAVSIVCGVAGAFLLSLYVDRSKKFMEVMKICMCLTSVSCSAFAVVSLEMMRMMRILMMKMMMKI